MYKHILFIFLISIQFITEAQTIKGMVASEDHELLIGATVLEMGTLNGTITDENGRWTLKLNDRNSKIIVSFTGFQPDTLKPNFDRVNHIMLAESSQSLNEVVVKSNSTFMDELEPKHVEVITEKELLKAACCNLSESFETNASVDVSYTDALSGAKTIRMLGLDGKYVQINRENVPFVRGLIGRYGMGYIPGTWLQSIDVAKGAGTVVNGYESMTGQLNVELKKPEASEKLYLNSYINSFGRAEMNANTAFEINEKISGGVLFHSDYLGTGVDRNNDGFMDIPKSRQFNILNRYKYDGDRVKSQLGIHMMNDEKAGGQTGFGFGDNNMTSPEYGFLNQTTKAEVFGKLGIIFPKQPYKGWGFIYSASYTDIRAGFGRKSYDGTEKTIYTNVIHQNIIGNTFHQYKTGVSFLYDEFRESLSDSSFQRTEIVPGGYFEYSYLPDNKISLIIGARADFHNLYGTMLSPRLHAKYQFGKNTNLRLAIGRGYRVGNPVVENTNILVSNRQLIVRQNLDPEIVWNMGGSLATQLPVGTKKINFIADYFYTTFENQLIYDMDRNSQQLVIYNLNGSSYAHSLQLEANYSLSEFLNVKAAYKYYDVKSTINGDLREMPYISRDRFFLNASYSTKYEKWTADATLQWYGNKRLPNTTDKPAEFQRASESPDYYLLNGQISRGFRWGNIYLGSENLLNFKQENPIIDAENPFSENFDASIVWAPIAGRMIYAGFRYKIK